MSTLATREMGRTGLQVTSLGYGAMELRGAPRGRQVEPGQVEFMLNNVLDSGINYIDTSIDYGESEESIGKYISHRRSEYYLATKCGCLVGAPPPTGGQRAPHLYTRKNITAGVEQSLARMKTDYIDVMQFHSGPGPSRNNLHEPTRQTLEENGLIDLLLDLKREGKIRFLGMSSTLPNLVDHIAMGVFDVFQIPYSALQRQHEDIITKAAQAGAGIVIRGGAAKGSPSDGKQQTDTWELWQKAKLDDILDDMTRMEFILRYTFTHPAMHTTIVGTINPEHLRDNLHALKKGPLPLDIYDEAQRRLAAAGTAPQGN